MSIISGLLLISDSYVKFFLSFSAGFVAVLFKAVATLIIMASLVPIVESTTSWQVLVAALMVNWINGIIWIVLSNGFREYTFRLIKTRILRRFFSDNLVVPME